MLVRINDISCSLILISDRLYPFPSFKFSTKECIIPLRETAVHHGDTHVIASSSERGPIL